MINKSELLNGMTVRSADGDKLGKIIAIENESILIEKGIFFPRDYRVNFNQMDQVSNGDLYLKWGTNLVEEQYDSFYGTGSYQKETADKNLWTDYNRTSRNVQSEQRIPVSEEELRVNRKGMQEVGRVKVYKTVHTEDQHFTIPVTREQVHIERVPGSQSRTSDANTQFKEDSVTIPVHEEQVEVTKRPTVKEEIRVQKTSEQVGKEVGGKVRKEEAQIKKEVYIDRNDHDLHP